MSDPIEDYIRANRDKYAREALTEQLVAGGHNPAAVEGAWNRVGQSQPQPAWNPQLGLIRGPDGNKLPFVIRVYKQEGKVSPEEAFAKDATILAGEGYRPTSQQWRDGKIGIGRAVALGVFSLLAKPAGTLTVTYELAAPVSHT